MSNLQKWHILSRPSGRLLAEVEAINDIEALDVMAQQHGFLSFLFAACSSACPKGWSDVEVVSADNVRDLEVREHASPHYSPRTWHNAKSADLTVAIAVDFNTAGEKLTHKAAGERYLGIPLEDMPAEASRKILDDLARRKLTRPVINIAGNGIYSLSGKGWDQQAVNQHLYDILSVVNQHVPIARIISGGQTGVDLAGIVAAYALGIPSVATLPNRFIQRNMDGQDKTHSMQEIVNMVELGVSELQMIKTQAAATGPDDLLEPVAASRHAPFKLRRR